MERKRKRGRKAGERKIKKYTQQQCYQQIMKDSGGLRRK